MIRLVLLLLLALPAAARAEIDYAAEKDAQAAVQALVESCLQQEWACIGKAALTCFQTDLAPIKPVFLAPKPSFEPLDWCYQAEQKVWQERLDSDIMDIRRWLPDGPALQDFEGQQAAFTSYIGKTFPFDHEEPRRRVFITGVEITLPLVAMRALQVGSIRELIRACGGDQLFSNRSICKYMYPAP